MDDSLKQFAASKRRVEELTSALRRAQQRIDRIQTARSEVLEAVRREARDALLSLDIPAVAPPKKDARKGSEEVCIAVLSDLQLGKRTRTYNTRIAGERMERYAEKLLRLAEIQRADHPVRELRVWLLGDIVEGELIFPGQAHLIDSSLLAQVKNGTEIIVPFLRRMLASFEQVHVTAVIGNHGALGGRARRDYNPETNADRMLYWWCRDLLAGEKRLSWNVPYERNDRAWYAIDPVGVYRPLLIHGDQFRWGIKTPSTERKILGWHSGAIPERFTDVVCGHWHQLNLLSLTGADVTLRCNGSTESHNPYAQEHIGSMGKPGQWALFAHPKHGITGEYRVWLT